MIERVSSNMFLYLLESKISKPMSELDERIDLNCIYLYLKNYKLHSILFTTVKNKNDEMKYLMALCFVDL